MTEPDPERVARPDIVARYMRLAHEAAQLEPFDLSTVADPGPVGAVGYVSRRRAARPETAHERGLRMVGLHRCYWCARDLREPESVARGVGPDCFKEHGPIPSEHASSKTPD